MGGPYRNRALRGRLNLPKKPRFFEYEPLVYITNQNNLMSALKSCLKKGDLEALVEVVEIYLWALQVKASMVDGEFPKDMPDDPKIDRALVEEGRDAKLNVISLINNKGISSVKNNTMFQIAIESN